MTTGPACPIGKLEKLLLAVDNSEYSEGAIREALKFSTKCGSRVFASMTLETNPEYETIGSNVFEKEEAEVAAERHGPRPRPKTFYANSHSRVTIPAPFAGSGWAAAKF